MKLERVPVVVLMVIAPVWHTRGTAQDERGDRQDKWFTVSDVAEAVGAMLLK